MGWVRSKVPAPLSRTRPGHNARAVLLDGAAGAGLERYLRGADVDVLAGSRADGQILAQVQRHVVVLRRDSLDRPHRPDRDAVQVVEEQRTPEIGGQRGDVVVGSVDLRLDACPQTHARRRSGPRLPTDRHRV